VKLNKISKSFFINLDRRKDRLDHIYKNTPFFTERFSAVDSKSLELTDEIKKLFPNDLYLKKKKSEIACALSHYGLWQQLVNDKSADNYLILEDDVVFEKGFTKFWNNVWSHHIPQDYYLLYLGGCQPYNKSQYHKALQPYNNYFNNVKKQDFFTKDDHYWHMNASSYVISKQCASLMCQWVEEKGFDAQYSIESSNLDIFMINFVNKNKLFSAPNKLFHLNPLMARQLHEENNNIELDKNSDIRFDEDRFTEETNSTYDVCFCCDSNLIEYAINPINALCQKNKNNNINIHFIYSGEESDLYVIEQFLADKHNISFKKYMQEELIIECDKSWKSISHISSSANLKLQMPEILKDVNRVIYFDIDTIPYVNLSEFDNVKTDLSGIALRPEIKNGWRTFNGSKGTVTENKNPLSFGDRVLGNCGVIVLDLERLRKEKFTDFCLTEKKNNNYKIPTTGGDQDPINLFCKCNFDVLPDELNILVSDQLKDVSNNIFKLERCITFQENGVHLLKRDNITEHNEGVLHFIGKDKPWNSDCLGSEFWGKFSLKPIQTDTDLKTKQNEFIKLKNEWMKFKDYNFLDFVAKNLPKRGVPKEKYTCYNPGKKIGIVSLYTPEISEYAIESEISIRDYAFKQGYTFYVYRDKLDKESHPNWSKPHAILNHLDNHETIVWMDSDTIIFNPNQKFENILSECVPIKKIIACEDIGANSMLNSGVIFFRNHKYTKNLIKRWKDFHGNKSELYSSGGDQEVFCDILKRSDTYGNNRKIFPMSKFNTDPRLVDNETFIMHFMAYGNTLKSVFMRYWGSK